jgi:hypothetical protein
MNMRIFSVKTCSFTVITISNASHFFPNASKCTNFFVWDPSSVRNFHKFLCLEKKFNSRAISSFNVSRKKERVIGFAAKLIHASITNHYSSDESGNLRAAVHCKSSCLKILKVQDWKTDVRIQNEICISEFDLKHKLGTCTFLKVTTRIK